MAQDVAGFIDEHKLQNTTLIGHSMGAKTAMTLALQSPELVHDIVSVDNAPIDAALLSSFGKYVQGMKRIEEAGVTRQAEADAILKDYEQVSFLPSLCGHKSDVDLKSLPIRQFLLGNLHRPTGEKTQKFKVPLRILGAALDNLGDFPFKDPGEVRFAKPALFVRGTQSKYIPDEALPIIGQFFPKFELADIDAGHWVISEKPEEFRQGKTSCDYDVCHKLILSFPSCCRILETETVETNNLMYKGIIPIPQPYATFLLCPKV
jgi:pimeloyl-ACP methyl ester carboxylesterase